METVDGAAPPPDLDRIVSRKLPAPAKPKLYHFEHHTFAAPGEPVRLTLIVGGVDFDDIRIPREGPKWPELKDNDKVCPFAQLPVMDVGGTIITQANSILRYAGLLAGLYPAHDVARVAKVDEILGAIQDIKGRMLPSMLEMNTELKREMRSKLGRDVLPFWFSRLEASLNANDARLQGVRGFAVGDRLTIADLALVCFLGWFQSGAILGIPSTLTDEYPRLTKVVETALSVPQVFKWRQANPTKYYNESDWLPAIQGLSRQAR